ncbi:MAG: SMC-Scp complex subunit ScpB [Nitrospira sp. WS110]|nr:SMC-Scp complex subunit ScpB [Nitrospira sp. WS110]
MEGDMTSGEADLVQETTELSAMDIAANNGLSTEGAVDLDPVRSGAELQAILESLLFVSSEPMSVVRLTSVMGTVTKVEVEEGLRNLGQALEQEGRGVRLAEIAGGYRIVTKQEYVSWIKRLDKSKTTAKLSRSALESLAIIAYKQPLVRAEIEEIRGVEASGVLRTLLERKLVRIVGRKEVPGRPIMYGTTKYFLEHFGLSDLSQLPPLREFKELGEGEQALLPIDGDRVPEEDSEKASIETIEIDEETSVSVEVRSSHQLQEMFDPQPASH